jgi:hypothetical protein
MDGGWMMAVPKNSGENIMAFVNDKITEADRDNLREICGEYIKAHLRNIQSWTVDRERQMFLVEIWAHHEVDYTKWAFYWHGEWILFEMKVKDLSRIITKEHVGWIIYHIKGFVVPETLKAQQEQLIADFREAWPAYAEGGIYWEFSHRNVTVEFVKE